MARYLTIESCTVLGTRLEGQTRVSTRREGQPYEDPPTPGGLKNRSRVLIARAGKRVAATSPADLLTALDRVTPPLAEFAAENPGKVATLLSLLLDEGRVVTDHPLWREGQWNWEGCLEDYLPRLRRDVLTWHTAEPSAQGIRLKKRSFNVVVGRSSSRKIKMSE